MMCQWPQEDLKTLKRTEFKEVQQILTTWITLVITIETKTIALNRTEMLLTTKTEMIIGTVGKASEEHGMKGAEGAPRKSVVKIEKNAISSTVRKDVIRETHAFLLI